MGGQARAYRETGRSRQVRPRLLDAADAMTVLLEQSDERAIPRKVPRANRHEHRAGLVEPAVDPLRPACVAIGEHQFVQRGAVLVALLDRFRDRFGIHLNLDFYTVDEMQKILERSAKILSVSLNTEEIHAVALRSRGTPRIGNRLLARVRDFVEVLAGAGGKEKASELQKKWGRSQGVEAVQKALDFLDVDIRGLQPLDRRYLMVICELFKGGPAGVEALAASLSEDRSTLEEMVEPYLLKEGFIIRTPRGRVATDLVYSHLGLKGLKRQPSLDATPGLFDESL